MRITARGLARGALCLLMGCLVTLQAFAAAPNTFSPTGSLGTARNRATATLLPDGRVLLAGGLGDRALASAELYDPASGMFTATGNLIVARYYATATLLPDGRVLIAGGYDGADPLASAELYDPATGTFAATGNLLTARYQATASLLADGRVLIVGGAGDRGRLASAEIYDPASGAFSTTGSPVGGGRQDATATLLADGQVLIAGGVGAVFNPPLASAELYDPASGTFSATGNMIAARRWAVSTLLPDGRVLVAGGAAGSTALASAELYDPASRSFTAAGPLTWARYEATATLLPNGQVLVAGGFDSARGYLSSTELYDPLHGVFTPSGSLARGRNDATATLLPSGRVLIAGGYGAPGPLASAEVYESGAGAFTPTGSLAAAREWATATPLPDGRVLVAGGATAAFAGFLDSAELYDPMSGAFAATGHLATARAYANATLLPSGRVLVAGGWSNGAAVADAELYDPASGVFTAGGSMETGRAYASATLLPDGHVLFAGGMKTGATGAFAPTGGMAEWRSQARATLLRDGRVLVAGGLNGLGSLASAEIYAPASGTFIATGSLAQRRHAAAQILLPDGRVLVAGGYSNGLILAGAELYDPVSGTFTATGSLATGRAWAIASLLPDGRVLIAGGCNNNFAPVASAELYDPASGTFSAVGNLVTPRYLAAAAALPDGRLLVVGGESVNGGGQLASAEVFERGLGFDGSRRPQLDAMPKSVALPAALHLTGQGFRASTQAPSGARAGSEGSSGSTNGSPTNYPLMLLQRIDNGQRFFVRSDAGRPWTDTTFDSAPLPPFDAATGNGLPYGHYHLTAFVNAIPSVSRVVALRAPAPDLALLKSHAGDFSQGQSGATYTLIVRNDGDGASRGAVTVTETLPAGVVLSGMAGAGWTCTLASAGCTRADALPPGAAYPPIIVTVDVSATMPAGIVTNVAHVGGGGDETPANNSASDPTTIRPVAASLSIAGTSTQTAPVGAAFAEALIVQVRDRAGMPMPGVSIAFAAPETGAGAVLSSSAATTDAIGNASVTATANIVAGSYGVAASSPGLAPVTFTLTNTAGPATRIVVAGGSPQSAEVNTAFALPLVVKVTDAYGNPVADAGVAFSVPEGGASASLSAPMMTTDADGEAGITATANTIAGAYSVRAGVAGVEPATFALTNAAGPATTFAIAGGSPQSAIVNTAFAAPLAVHLADAYGNAIAGADITYAAPASGPSATLSAAMASTDATGNARIAAVAGDTIGSYAVTASAIGVADVGFQLNNTAGPPASLVILGGSPQSTKVGTAFPAPLSAQVRDAGGHPLAGINVTFAAPMSGASATLSSPTAMTDANGVVTIGAVANEHPGAYMVTASIAEMAVEALFALTNTPDVALALSIDAGRAYAQYGHTLDYVVTLSNMGSSVASHVSVGSVLAPQLDVALTQWRCLGGGTCTASGEGALSDSEVVIPAHGSVSWIVSAPIRADAEGDVVVTTVSAKSPDQAADATAGETTILVVFRDGFDRAGDDGVNGLPLVPLSDPLRVGDSLWLPLVPAMGQVGVFSVLTAYAADGSGFRIDRFVHRGMTWLRLAAIDSSGRDQPSQWFRTDADAGIGLALVASDDHIDVVLLNGAQEIYLNLAVGGAPTYAVTVAMDARAGVAF